MTDSLCKELAGLPRWIWLVLLTVLCVQYVLVLGTELSFDEAYYWLWSQHLQLSYYDHPPMTAWLIALSTSVFGNGNFGVRFFGPPMLLATSFFLSRAARDFGGNERAQMVAALFLPATILGSALIVFTPDTPLLFFSSWLLREASRLYKTADRKIWVNIGAIAGCALLSKYTALMLCLGILFWVFVSPARRRDIGRPHIWAGLLVALVVFSPVLIWNAGHDWASFAKQGTRFFVDDWFLHWKSFGDFIGAQFLVLSPLLFPLALYAGMMQAQKASRGEERALLLVLLALPLLLFVTALSLLRKVEANWPLVSVPPLVVMTALTLSAQWPLFKNYVRTGLGAGLIGAGLIVLYIVSPLQHGFGRTDISQRLSGHQQVADDLARLAVRTSACLIVTPDYATQALMSYYLRGRYAVMQINQPERYTGWRHPEADGCTGRAVLAVGAFGDKAIEAEFMRTLKDILPLAVLHRMHRGAAVQDYQAWSARSASNP